MIATALFAGLLAIASANPIAPAAESNLEARQTVALCDQYAYHAANGYEILNNLWGRDAASSGSQCTYYEGTSGNGIRWSSTWNWQGAPDNVKSYVYAGRQLTRGNTIARIRSMPTQINWSYNTTNGVRANVAYDIFTAADPNHSNSSGDYELMIWLGRLGSVYPISQGNNGPIATVTISGVSFELFYGLNGSMKVYSFVRAGGISNNQVYNFNSDAKLFFNYIQQNHGFPASSQNLIVYQMGTEAFTGGPTKFQVNSFSASVNL